MGGRQRDNPGQCGVTRLCFLLRESKNVGVRMDRQCRADAGTLPRATSTTSLRNAMNGALPDRRGGGGWKCSATPSGNCLSRRSQAKADAPFDPPKQHGPRVTKDI
jgi:hypothetical protein